MLLHLPRMKRHGLDKSVKCGPALAGHGAEAVRNAISETIMDLPAYLCRSLTWDQGAEMAQHAQLRIDTGLDIYFCDSQGPWQRGSNENTNGLLRQYFPMGTDLTQHGADKLRAVAHALNSRPRKTLGWRSPAEALDGLLESNMIEGVAATGWICLGRPCPSDARGRRHERDADHKLPAQGHQGRSLHEPSGSPASRRCAGQRRL